MVGKARDLTGTVSLFYLYGSNHAAEAPLPNTITLGISNSTNAFWRKIIIQVPASPHMAKFYVQISSEMINK
jgi:hypothetical protein